MKFIILTLSLALLSCQQGSKAMEETATYPEVIIVGAMKNVMWKGELAGRIDLDTIADTKGLYGLGPQSFLTGELLLKDGVSYLSKVSSDSTMSVEKTYQVSAPFFVYAKVNEWQELKLPAEIHTIPELEAFIDQQTTEARRPFAFKLRGKVAEAVIHVQNLPAGSTVTSPEEAHQGQTTYRLQDEQAEIIGFFSTQHKGIFTHHDSFLHMHLLTQDETMMGHLDEVLMNDMALFLPKS